MNHKRTIISLFLILMLLSPLSAAQVSEEPPRVALVLSGGAALGFAHVGVLEVLDELGIPVDMIIGTSMGGLVGGLYAIGYTPKEIRQVADQTDWLTLFTSPKSLYSYYFGPVIDSQANIISFSFDKNGIGKTLGLISDQNIITMMSDLTAEVSSITDFDRFKIPFRTVAVDILTGDAHLFDSGSIAQAMRSTMSIPFLFTPYEIDGIYYIDGGARNNLPVDIAKEAGYEYVIAVDVDPKKVSSIDEMSSNIDIFTQYIHIAVEATEQENAKMADILIEPDLSGLNVSQFSRYEEFFDRGREAALSQIKELEQLAELLSSSRDVTPRSYDRAGYTQNQDRPLIASVELDTIDPEFPLDLYTPLQGYAFDGSMKTHLKRLSNRIVNTGRYSSVLYYLSEKHDEYVLTLHPVRSDRGKHSLGIGATFSGAYCLTDTDTPWLLEPALTTSLVMTELFGTEAYLTLDVAVGEQFTTEVELFAPLGNLIYFHPSIDFHNLGFQETDGLQVIAENRSIMASTSQEMGFMVGRFMEFGLKLEEGLIWSERTTPTTSSYETDFSVTLGPSLSWKNVEDISFIHDGLISYLSLELPLIAPSSWYERFQFRFDHHIPLSYDSTFSYDLLIGSYRGRFTAKEKSFELSGWDGVYGYAPGTIIKDDLWLWGMGFQHRFAELSRALGLDIYGLAGLRIGGGYDQFPSLDQLDAKFGGSLGLGINSILGEVILGYGINQDANGCLYIVMN